MRPVGASDTNSQKALIHAQQELGFWVSGGGLARMHQAGAKQGDGVGWGGHGLEGGMGPQYGVQVRSGLGVGSPGGSPRRHSSLLGRALSSPPVPPCSPSRRASPT